MPFKMTREILFKSYNKMKFKFSSPLLQQDLKPFNLAYSCANVVNYMNVRWDHFKKLWRNKIDYQMRRLKILHLYNILPEAFIFALKQRRSRKFKAVFNLHLPSS
jgi:hypothetical protein